MESKLLFVFYIGHNSFDWMGETETFFTENHIFLSYHYSIMVKKNV